MADLTDEQLAEIEQRAEAATPGPWEHGDRYQIAGVLRERFGDGRCAYCANSRPSWVGVRDINGQRMMAHVHEADEPWWPHGIVATLSGDRLPCAVVIETDEYGLMGAADADFIAAARTDVPVLLRALRDARAENDHMAGVLSDVFCEQTGGRLSYPTYDARTVNAEINDARQQEIDAIEAERDSLRAAVERVEKLADDLEAGSSITGVGGAIVARSFAAQIRAALAAPTGQPDLLAGYVPTEDTTPEITDAIARSAAHWADEDERAAAPTGQEADRG